MDAYRLIGHFSRFEGTDHESSRDDKIFAISFDEDTLYQIKNQIDGQNEGWGYTKNRSPYCAAATEYWDTMGYEKRKTASDKFKMTLRDGKIVEVPLYPVDSYYGEGSLDGLYVEKFDYLHPDDFV